MDYPAAPTLITSPRDRDALFRDLAREPRVAFDLESDGFHHYREHLSLVQVASPRGMWLVDPLASPDGFGTFGELLANPRVTKVLHGSDYDIRTLDRTFGFHVSGLRDTATATLLLFPELMGLGRAVESFLGVKLPKQARLQRFDWSRRPLPADALEYATLDVAHLLALDDALQARLRELGRTEWLAEECALMEKVRWEAPPPPEDAAFGSKGAFDLSPVALAVFRELWMVRERSAERMDRPAFKVIGAAALMALAQDPSLPPGRIPGANVRWLEANAGAIREAVRRGRETGGIAHPSRSRRRPSPWTQESRARWEALNAVRAAKAAELGIAPSTLWPTRGLEAVCLEPGRAEAEFAGESAFSVRRWQRGILAEALRGALAKALSSET